MVKPAVEITAPNADEFVAKLRELDAKWHVLRKVKRLRRYKSFEGYFHCKCNFELDKLLDRFEVPYYMRIPLYNAVHEFVNIIFKSDGEHWDFFWEFCCKKHLDRHKVREHVKPEVIEGMKEMLSLMWKFRDIIRIEFNNMRMLMEYEKEGRQIDWENFSLWELEFADEQKDEEQKDEVKSVEGK